MAVMHQRAALQLHRLVAPLPQQQPLLLMVRIKREEDDGDDSGSHGSRWSDHESYCSAIKAERNARIRDAQTAVISNQTHESHNEQTNESRGGSDFFFFFFLPLTDQRPSFQ